VYLKALAASGYRNLATFRIEPAQRFNIFEGLNGQGKTNLLESIYLLSAFKSPRDARAAEMITLGEASASVYGEIVRRDISRTVEVQLSAKGKKVILDGKAITALPSSFSHLNAVVFGPDDLGLTKGGPQPRRTFMDRAVFASTPDYLLDLKAYRQSLDARNKLVRDMRERGRGWRSGAPVDADMVAAFEESLITYGLRVLSARLRFLRAFTPCFQAVFSRVTDGELRAELSPVLSAHLDPQALEDDPETQREAWRQLLARGRDADIRLGYTRVGPHADDLLCTIDDRPVRTFASQGQHRAFVLALKLAELEITRQAIGIYPIFLLDDVSSELDERRNAHLMATLMDSGGQVFITTTDRRWIRVGDEGLQVYRVHEGEISAADVAV